MAFVKRSAAGLLLLWLGCAFLPAARALEIPFAAATVDGTGKFPRGIATGDLDGDGDLDVVSALFNDSAVVWNENTAGDGSSWTQRAVSSVAVTTPQAVAVADVDGDGDLDVLAALRLADSVVWFENDNGDGSSWTLGTITSTVDDATDVVAADIDGDGDIDAVSSSSTDDKIAWHENTNGDGSAWTERVISTAADAANGVATEDIDGDGDLDVLSVNRGSDRAVAWFENSSGDGSTWSVKLIISSLPMITAPVAVSTGDVDHDGDPDVLVAYNSDDRVRWFENKGGLVWTEKIVTSNADSAQDVVAADLDRDGDLDLVATSAGDSKVAWHENTAGDASAWTERIISTAATDARKVQVADIDGDGDLDVVASTGSNNQVLWFENLTMHRSAAFPVPGDSFPGTNSVSYDVGDLDGDGDPDLVFGRSVNGVFSWARNDDKASTWTEQDIAISNDFKGPRVELANIDGDGDLDILFSERLDNNVAWLENVDGLGTSLLEHPIDTASASFPRQATSADLDSDGDVDVLTFTLDLVHWHENSSGDGTSWVKSTVASGIEDLEFVLAADVDGDGDNDAISVSTDATQGIAWHENTAGDGSAWTPRTISTGQPDAEFAVAVDIDGDGDLDLAVTWASSEPSGRGTWHENTAGDGSAWTEHLISDERIQFFGVGDFDGDGDSDLLVPAVSTGLRWMENRSGDGSLWIPHVVGDLPGILLSQTILPQADLDRDGDLDLLYWRFEPHWRPNLGGQFALPTTDVAQRYLAPVSGPQEVLRIDATHRGRTGDSAVDLEEFEFLFEETPGDPLDINEQLALFFGNFETVTNVYLDDGSGRYEEGVDVPVGSSIGFSANGEMRFGLIGNLPEEKIEAAEERTYLLVLEVLDQLVFRPSTFRVTHLTESSSSAKDAVHGLPLELEYQANVSTAQISLELSTGSCSSPAELELAGETVSQTLVCTAGSTLSIRQSTVTGVGDLTLESGDGVLLGPQFEVEAGGTLTVVSP